MAALKTIDPRRIAVAFMGALALVGVYWILDAVSSGGASRFVWFGALAGALLVLPLIAVVIVRSRAPAALRRVAAALIAAAAAFVLLELLARATGLEVLEEAIVVRDPELGQVMVATVGDADARGFRNPAAVERADVVFVGDSQTYGFALRRSESLPARFGARTGRSSYGMALGGYGPVQYRALVRRAVELDARDVVVVLYLGNDLFDAHRFAGLSHAVDLRDPELRYPAAPTDATDVAPAVAPNAAVGFVELATRSSRVLSRVSLEVRRWLKSSAALTDVYGAEPDQPLFEDAVLGTQFTPSYRRRAVDAERAEIRDGLRITELCLDGIAVTCREHGARPVLVLLPTKETAYHRLLSARQHELAATIADVAAAELACIARLRERAVREGFVLVDAIEPLTEALERGRPVWPRIADGHLSATGVDVLVDAIVAALDTR